MLENTNTMAGPYTPCSQSNGIAFDEIVDACRRIGLEEGETIFVHSDLLSIDSFQAASSDNELLCFVNALQHVVGEMGTLIMPTFSFSFLDEKWSGPHTEYDENKSVSRTGSLSEYFRKMPDVVRTDHPTHSVAIWGNDKEYFSTIGNSTFDLDSIFGKIFERNVTLVGLGADIKFFTFIHFVEKQFGVPYRFETRLKGTVISNGSSIEKEIRFYKQKKNTIQQHQYFRDYLLQTGKVNRTDLGHGQVMAIKSRVFFKEGVRRLDQDIHYFAKKKSLKKLSFEKIRGITSLIR